MDKRKKRIVLAALMALTGAALLALAGFGLARVGMGAGDLQAAIIMGLLSLVGGSSIVWVERRQGRRRVV